MDYQRNGWFRPTCGVTRQSTTAYSTVRENPAACSTARENHSACEKADDTWQITPTSLSMVWSPCQNFHKLYEPSKALSRGTLFAELDKPFTGKC